MLIVRARIAAQDTTVSYCQNQVKWLSVGNMHDAWRKSTILAAINQQRKCERLAEQMRSEFGLPPKYPEAREQLHTTK